MPATVQVSLTEAEWNSLCPDRSNHIWVTMTEAEFDAFIDNPENLKMYQQALEVEMELRENDFSALPRCCGNVGTFRDAIDELRVRKGMLDATLKANLLRYFEWVQGCYDLSDPDFSPLHHLMQQVIASEIS